MSVATRSADATELGETEAPRPLDARYSAGEPRKETFPWGR